MDLRILIAGRIPEDLRRDLSSLEPVVGLTGTEESDPSRALAGDPHLVVLGESAPFAAREVAVCARELQEPVPIVAVGDDPDADLDRALATLGRDRLLRLARRLARMRRALGHPFELDRPTGTLSVPGEAAGGFLERLEYEFSRALRFRHPLALILLRLDGRDRLAELYGEGAVADFAAMLEGAARRSVREVDLLFRITADEIAAILPETPAPGAAVVAERFLIQTSRLVFKPNPTGSRPVLPMKTTSSIGVTDGPREGIGTSRDLLLRAREFVSAAGAAGGGRVAVDRPVHP